MSRRKFIKNTALGVSSIALGATLTSCAPEEQKKAAVTTTKPSFPIVISTWDAGIEANVIAMKTMVDGGSSLDAVEMGVRVIEDDPKATTVGYGGFPDREGNVTLDACIMDAKGNAGSVSALKNIKNPISVARKVMEETPHVMLVGEGALQFAKEQGFKEMDLLTADSKKAWQEWLKKEDYSPIINIENHDTIGMLAIDENGDMSGSCTTSGLAFKMHGRVGDSPIIGAGLFVDNEVGGAVATGLGELMLKTLSSFLTVELMAMGKSPAESCKEAVMRIVKKYPEMNNSQVVVLAMDKLGNTGSYSIYAGFNYAKFQDDTNELIKGAYLKEWE